ncbi:xanthine dehydrogenase family protein subunit M [Angustibacter sp. Root456]|uniref:FAD binding domain-containing protein n=1 Tax=Angustibacter sp. Root456 TaxID=1736539 RepID=UPI0006F97CE8|nr:xanthine dehydrogenase family protein subunit M [Angustibacter sp. Root456]KQX66672.1 molybdopterin dehydrogenase [Angustibacter sp. Root456]
MKPAPFEYHRPAELAEALTLLSELGAEAKVLAGGQSLLPLLSMRLASPAHVVDVNALPGLGDVHVDGSGVRFGALVRHSDLERDGAAFMVQPLLRQGLRNVAHPTIRNRGTTVGSICHADPAGEMPAVLALLEGAVIARSATGERTVPASELFVGPLESSLRPDELAVAAQVPLAPAGRLSAVVEIARRHGDYAMCGVAVTVDTVDDQVTSARAAYVSMGPTPPVLDLTEAVRGQAVHDADWAAAAELAVSRLEPEPDIHATADYRAHLARVLTVRAFQQAVNGGAQ